MTKQLFVGVVMIFVMGCGGDATQSASSDSPVMETQPSPDKGQQADSRTPSPSAEDGLVTGSPEATGPTGVDSGENAIEGQGEVAEESLTAESPVQGLMAQAIDQLQNQNAEKAADLAEQALEMDPTNKDVLMLVARIAQIRGLAIFQAGDRDGANEHLLYCAERVREVLAMNVEFNEVEQTFVAGAIYNDACCKSIMGKPDEAIASLKESIELGYVEYEHMKTDPDLDPIRDREDFKALVK